MAYLLAIHVLSAVVWVGGMFFALLVLRPAVGPLEPAVRLALWRRVFARFFPAVGVSVLALLATGHAMILDRARRLRRNRDVDTSDAGHRRSVLRFWEHEEPTSVADTIEGNVCERRDSMRG